ncbi:sulfatase-like hydrolase/transferase [Compostibacter hankyongensis]|uniref:GP-PDE domain-containing protein n=1 Tax=Compostibacter hankyongensis TaxID=1007089 RepID=A0ABP8FJT7_9BACT
MIKDTYCKSRPENRRIIANIVKIMKTMRIPIRRFLFLAGLFLLTLQSYGQQKPNIILILADDLGYGDLGCYGQRMISTPHIDSLAAGGMRFTNYYAGCSVCAPSREALLTGRHTGHTYIRGNFLTDDEEDPAMPDEKQTVAELMKSAGYRTGLFGKWGLGGEGHGPETQGFDSSFCYLDQIKAHNYYPPYLYETGRRVMLPGNAGEARGTYSHDLFAEKTLDFIRGSKPGADPFFLYLPYTIPHGAYTLPPDTPYAAKDWPQQFKVYATMISKLDRDVGRIVQLLREKGLADNTIIFFASDNGANMGFARFFGSNGKFSGSKFGLYEGGIRVPLIAYWPGKIRPGQVSSHVTAAWDFLPTLCQLSGTRAPRNIDGISFLPALKNSRQPEHPFLYWEYYNYNYNWYKPGNKLPRNYLLNAAVRYGKWKAIRDNLLENPDAPVQLYDLETDPGEKKDVAAQHPDVVARVQRFFRSSSIADPPYFPYAPDTAAPLHVFRVSSPAETKALLHYTPDRIPFVSSHRGGPTLGYPENAIATFRNTLRHTWSIMEMDPHYTRDSAIVVMHDPTLDRTSTGHGKISDHTLAELQQLQLKDVHGNVTQYKIPTLDAVLEWAKGKTLLIMDQKDVSVEVRARKIMEHHAEANVLIMAYTFEDAQKCYALDKDIMMEVFIPDRAAAEKFEKTGVPWSNVVAFVTHGEPKDSGVFRYLHERGVMAIRGSSRNIDKQYTGGEISKQELLEGYRRIIRSGADIVEADLGIEAGQGLGPIQVMQGTKKKFFDHAAQ